MTETQEQFNQRAGMWFGLTVRTWIPIVIAFIGLITYIQAISFSVSVLEARADELEDRNDIRADMLNDFSNRLTKIESNTTQTKDDLRALKAYFNLP